MYVALLLFLFWQQDFQAEGLKALEAKQFPTAIAAFDKAVAADPKDFSAYFNLALAHSMAGDAAKAIPNYRKTLELSPGLYEAELNLGVVLLESKQGVEAVPLLKSASEKKPKEFRPVYYYGEALLAAAQYPESEAQFRLALSLDPKSQYAQAGLGRALARQGKLKDAEAAFRQAGDADGLLELGGLYEKAKDNASAIAIYQNFPDNPAVKQRMGELLLDSGKAGDAIPQLEEAVKKSPTAANRYALATAYLRDKQTEKATQMMDAAIAAEPANADLHLSYAGLMRDQKNFQAAAQQYWKTTQLKPTSKEAWSGLATMLLSLENYPQALAAFDKLEALGDPNPGVYFLRALAYDKTKQYLPAIESYEKFLSVSQNKLPDEEFKARQRIRVIKKEMSRRR